jgi:chitinase
VVQAKQSAGLDHATLAFGVTRGSCALDAYLQDKMPDARAYVAAGGDLIVSMGGADGTYAEIACSDDQLFALLEKLMVDSGTRRIDWDVEGQQLNNVDATARRSRVLLRLQAKYPTLYTSFTLPSWLRGMPIEAVNLLRSTVAAGVRIQMVNVMVMSFGPENIRSLVSPATVGQAAEMSFEASATQLATVYPGKSAAQVRAMMGMTPMIGVNDDGATLTLADARMLADYVKAKGIGLLSYWSFQRDRAQGSAGMGPVGTYSGVAQGLASGTWRGHGQDTKAYAGLQKPTRYK